MITPPVLIYLGLGLLLAWISLDGRQTRCYSLLDWLKYLVDALRIALLWPLVLLAEKIETWRKTDTQTVSPCDEEREREEEKEKILPVTLLVEAPDEGKVTVRNLP